MGALRELFEELGFLDIRTYIQSGNVIFKVPGKTDEISLSEKIENAILKNFGFEVPVLLRTAEELQQAIDRNPFYNPATADIDRLHLTFLKKTPSSEKLSEITNLDFSPDNFEVSDREVFVYCSRRYSDSKLSNTLFEKKLKVGATTRNWKTVLKLKELSARQK